MSKRVLVSEDDCAIRALLDKVLSRHGLSADCVESGMEAAARLRAAAYDLVVLDLLTPGMSGYDVVDLLRRERPYLLARTVVMTAQHRVAFDLLPVAAIVRKPFDLGELDRLVERMVFTPPWRDRESRAEGGLQ